MENSPKKDQGKSDLNPYFTKGSISRRLMVAVVLFSSFITLITTSFQLYRNYQGELDQINRFFLQVETSYLEVISNSVWVVDQEQIRIQLDGLLRLPDVGFVVISINDQKTWSSGNQNVEYPLSKSFPLVFNYRGVDREIGLLETVVSLTGVYNRLLEQMFTILISNAIKTFLVAGFILYIFQRLVTKHLIKIASFSKQLELDKLEHQNHLLNLDRKSSTLPYIDELDYLSGSINDMIKRVHDRDLSLKNSEERYRAITESATDAIVSIDQNGVITFWNSWATRIFLFTRQEAMGSKVDIIIPKYYEDLHLQGFKRALKSGQLSLIPGHMLSITGCRKDGSIVPLEMTISHWKAKNRINFTAIIRDVTERKIAEDQIKAIVDNSNAVIFLKDTQGRYLLINQRYSELHHITNEEIIGKTDFDIFPRELAEKFWENDQQVLKAKTLQEIEELVPYDDGLHTVISIKFPLFDSENNPYAVCGMATDITERKNLELQLRQSKKMEAVGTLAGGVAHDFNNILGIIKGNVELGELGISDPKEVLQNIDKATERGKGLVLQLLTFSRKTQTSKQLLDPIPLIKEVLKFMRSTMPSSIKIVESFPNSAVQIYGDPTHIHQIIMNLCTNANYAMGEGGGVLTLEVKTLAINEEQAKQIDNKQGNYIEIVVKDTGLGIDQDILEHIFEPFFTTKTKEKGTGLGLSVVHGAVQECGGSIQIASEPGQGTTFKVYLPVANNFVDEEKVEIIANSPKKGKGRVLFVDDEAGLVDVCVKMLEALGYVAVGFTDPKEALIKFKKTPTFFDVVITDQVMPGIGGNELAAEIKKLQPDIPIFLCTGYSEQVTEESAAEAGFKGFFLKPVSMADLSKAVKDSIKT
ncbi:MAG: PAS domain S-box protein [Magnetococcales bacterium]|nr:PAS domain S-box protein [Magnetococcales bacterium]